MTMDSRDRWWWIPAKQGSRCDECGAGLPEDARVAYLPREKTIRCEICADAAGLRVEFSGREKRRMARERERKAKARAAVRQESLL
jgi:hypothetical protein